MALNLSDIKDAIRAYLEANIVDDVVEQAVPDAQTVLRNADGTVKPYVSYQFGDLQRLYGGARGLIGVRHDDYELPIRIQAQAPDAKMASDMADHVLDVALGFSSDYTGEVRKRPGGGMFSIVNTNGATECYTFPVSFAVTLQMTDS